MFMYLFILCDNIPNPSALIIVQSQPPQSLQNPSESTSPDHPVGCRHAIPCKGWVSGVGWRWHPQCVAAGECLRCIHWTLLCCWWSFEEFEGPERGITNEISHHHRCRESAHWGRASRFWRGVSGFIDQAQLAHCARCHGGSMLRQERNAGATGWKGQEKSCCCCWSTSGSSFNRNAAEDF